CRTAHRYRTRRGPGARPPDDRTATAREADPRSASKLKKATEPATAKPRPQPTGAGQPTGTGHPGARPPDDRTATAREADPRSASRHSQVAGVPRLEPRLTGPEPVGLPITPYPMGAGVLARVRL